MYTCMMKMTSALSGNEHYSICNYLSNFPEDSQNIHGYWEKKKILIKVSFPCNYSICSATVYLIWFGEIWKLFHSSVISAAELHIRYCPDRLNHFALHNCHEINLFCSSTVKLKHLFTEIQENTAWILQEYSTELKYCRIK